MCRALSLAGDYRGEEGRKASRGTAGDNPMQAPVSKLPARDSFGLGH